MNAQAGVVAPLRRDHQDRLARFGIPVDLIERAGVRSVSDLDARQAGVKFSPSSDLSGLLFEYRHPATGDLRAVRVRRDNPEVENGKARNKYVASWDPNHLYFAPVPRAHLSDSSIPVVIVEAESSALAVLATLARADRSVVAIATGGAYGWRGRIGRASSATGARVDETGPLPDFEVLQWFSRDVVILFDSNVEENTQVQAGERALARELTRRGAKVRLGRVPALPNVNGPDDLIAEKGNAALIALVDSAVDWRQIVPEPRPLQRSLPPSDRFPVESLGPILGPAAQKIHAVIQAPESLCAVSILAAATLAVQPHADVVLDGRVSPLSGFYITIALSGERKTGVDKVALRPHRQHQKVLSKQYESETRQYEIDAAAYKKSREEALKKARDFEGRKAALQALGDPPALPLLPLILATEPTYEGLVKLLADGRPSIGLFSDDGGRFLAGHAMNQDNAIKTASGLSELWDGTEVTRVRSGDGATLLYGRRLSVHLMAQPEVSQLLLSNAGLIDQGLISRCLCTYPESTVGARPYVDENLSTTPEIQQYSDHLLTILETTPPLAEGQRKALAPRSLPLTPEARALYIRFHNTVEQALAKELRDVRGFANKAPEHAARIAGVLTLIEDLAAPSVPLEQMAAGIEIAQFFLNEALRIFNIGVSDPELALAERLLVWLREQGAELAPLSRIYQCGPNPVRNAATARRLMRILEEHGWALPMAHGAVIDGKKHSEVWRVNL